MKKAIKVLAVLLAVCFCSSMLAMAAEKTASEVAKQGAFQFGMYPQSKVKDKAMIEQLNKLRGTSSKAAFRLGDAVYASVRVNGTGCKPGGSPFAFYHGYYPYDEKHGYETYWFKYEPITWRVLDKNEDGVLLLSEQVISTHTFNDAVRADNTWKNSDVRKWLNSVFKNTAFTAAEQAYLLTTPLQNEPNLICGTPSGNDTEDDKVFLPSISEITNSDYGFNVGWKDKVDDFNRPVGYYETDILPGEHSARSTGATDYAKCLSAWTHLDQETEEPLSTCFYWLRTAGENTTFASGVLPDGRVSMTGWEVDYTVLGIRPMVRVAPDAVPEGVATDPDAYVDPVGPIDPAGPTDPADPTNPTDPQTPDKTDQPFEVKASSPKIRYKQRNVKLEAPDTQVTWTSLDPQIAQVNENTGEVTILDVGTARIVATSVETGETVEYPMEIEYAWWQQLIRIFLFGWIWY